MLGTRDPGGGPASWRAMRGAFDRAMALWPRPAAKVAIPYAGRTLTGYWLDPDGDPTPRPLAILNNGSDGPVPDWEAVITPVVDFALARSGVDPARVALPG